MAAICAFRPAEVDVKGSLWMAAVYVAVGRKAALKREPW